MELLVSELELHTGITITTCSTNLLAEGFDERFTEEYICTDPDRWLPTYDKTDLDAVRKHARNARVKPTPRVELPWSKWPNSAQS